MIGSTRGHEPKEMVVVAAAMGRGPDALVKKA
jgi:hypothetical protein